MHRITSLGVLSCAKIFGAIYGCMGLLFIPFALIAGILSMLSAETHGAIGGLALFALALLAPIIYGGVGFLLGALTAWLYNLMAGRVGGIELELQVPASPAV